MRHPPPDDRIRPGASAIGYDMRMAEPDVTHSIVRFLSELVRIPSRAGIDPYEPVLDAVAGWLSAHKLPHEFVHDARGAPVAIWGRIGASRGRCYLLNATVDTAPFGDESRWTHAPLSAAQADGWLYGRGSGDSKAAVAIFCHALETLLPRSGGWSGSLAYVFDAGEHTGEFTGLRRFMEVHGPSLQPAGAMIGYPGNDRIAIGGRGFLRARVRVHGQAAHTGSSDNKGASAVWRAAKLVDALHATALPAANPAGFPLPPRASVTAVEGGSGFSVVPDLCMMNVDVRLTPDFDDAAARAHVARLVEEHDRAAPDLPRTEIEWIAGWPAYQLAADAPIVRALRDAAREVLGREPATDVVGPSSVGNLLHQLGVPATNGFGVTCENIHANDERIALDTIAPTLEIYCRALRSLLTG